MSNPLPKELIARLCHAVESHLGLHYPASRGDDMTRALRKGATDLGFANIREFAAWLLEAEWGEPRIEALTKYLTVGETHFFRDERLFSLLEGEVIPELINARRLTDRRLKIWSAGCATGEEPYSIAIVLRRLLPDIVYWRLTILATDVNRAFLRKAKKGAYSQWSFRSVRDEIKKGYFRTKGDVSEIDSDIKRMVTFAYLNLAKGAFHLPSDDPDPADIVFCRNVLMYFSQETQDRVVEHICQHLVDGGWLIVSPAEAPLIVHPRLSQVNFPGAILFRKGDVNAERRKAFDFSIFQPAIDPIVADSDVVIPNFATFAPMETVELPVPETVVLETPVASVPAPPATEGADYYAEAVALHEQGRYEEAVNTLLPRIEEQSCGQMGPIMALLARAYANQGKLDEAIEWSQKTISAEKLNPEYHYLHGAILHEQGMIEEAAAALRRAVFLDSELAMAHFALGNLARVVGKTKESARHFKTALSILERRPPEEPVPASDGLTAGRLSDIIVSLTNKETKHDRSRSH